MITAFDSTNLNDIPGDPELILYYLNGSWPASPNALARFTQQKEGISVTPFANVGDWLDVETGDAFPWQAPSWVQMRRQAGHPDPGVYVQQSLWKATINEFDLRGIAHPRWWIALYDGIAQVPAGAAGKQYAADHPGTSYYSGGHYDKSVFTSTLAGAIASHRGEEMDSHMLAQLIYLAGLGRVYVGTEGDWLVKIIESNPADFVGATLGAVVNSVEGKAWNAKLQELRSGQGDAAALMAHTHPTGPVTIPANSTGAAVKS